MLQYRPLLKVSYFAITIIIIIMQLIIFICTVHRATLNNDRPMTNNARRVVLSGDKVADEVKDSIVFLLLAELVALNSIISRRVEFKNYTYKGRARQQHENVPSFAN